MSVFYPLEYTKRKRNAIKIMTSKHKWVTVMAYMKKKSVKSKLSKKIAGFEPMRVALLVAVIATVSIMLFALMAVTH